MEVTAVLYAIVVFLSKGPTSSNFLKKSSPHHRRLSVMGCSSAGRRTSVLSVARSLHTIERVWVVVPGLECLLEGPLRIGPKRREVSLTDEPVQSPLRMRPAALIVRRGAAQRQCHDIPHLAGEIFALEVEHPRWALLGAASWSCFEIHGQPPVAFLNDSGFAFQRLSWERSARSVQSQTRRGS